MSGRVATWTVSATSPGGTVQLNTGCMLTLAPGAGATGVAAAIAGPVKTTAATKLVRRAAFIVLSSRTPRTLTTTRPPRGA